MGRLLFGLSAILFWGSFASAGLSVKQKELEKAAELAVERAAEKAAERAVEKALNSGNSSTITVTVKEAYENSKKTAEEAAAPGSESTKPSGTAQFFNRQYAPAAKGQYEVDESAEAAKLGISKEQVNSSVEELQAGADSVEAPGSAEGAQAEGDSGEAAGDEIDVDVEVDAADAGDAEEGGGAAAAEEASFESAREGADKPVDVPASGAGADASGGLDFSGDFVGLDISGADQSGAATGFKEGTFGMKRNSETFSNSYSKTDEYGGKAEVDDEDDAEIMKMYATDFGDVGWSSSKQKGWTRHRPLWDDTKNRVARQQFWDDSTGNDESKNAEKNKEQETVEKESSEKEKSRMRKRMTEDLGEGAADSSSPIDGSQGKVIELNHRELLPGPTNNSKVAVPMKVFVTIPMPYSGATRKIESKPVDAKFLQSTLSPKELNDEMRKDSSIGTTTTTTTTTSRPAYRHNPRIAPKLGQKA